MNCKKVFITSALISLICFLPEVSFSDTIEDNNITGSFYISGKYMPTASHFGHFSAKEDKFSTAATFGLKEDYNNEEIKDCKNTSNCTSNAGNLKTLFTKQNYSFKYENNPFLGFAGAVGYSMDGPRVELEVSYETFDVKNPDNSYKNNAHMYYLLKREASDLQTSTSGNQDNKSVYIKNEGLSDLSIMLNACYDIITDSIPFSPYVCAGIGTDLVSMFNVTNTKLSYQGKLGISYSISPEISIFVGGHFHKVIGTQFKDIPTILPTKVGSETLTAADSKHAIVTLNVLHFGAEIGGRVSF